MCGHQNCAPGCIRPPRHVHSQPLAVQSTAPSMLGKREVNSCWLPDLQLCQGWVAESALCVGCGIRAWCPR